jgi:RNA polymerase sigma factor (sigma-70 family)
MPHPAGVWESEMTLMEMPVVTTDPDRQPRDAIATRWAAGDAEAVRMAFDAWGGAIYTYCARRLPEDDAADATQEVFVSAWRARTQFDPERGVLAQWLFGIARNTCVTFHRRRARVPEPMADLPVTAGRTTEEDGLPDRLLLLGALQQLPDRQRRVLHASFMEGWTNAEVADRLELPLGTVKSDIRRGLLSLRAHLEVVP